MGLFKFIFKVIGVLLTVIGLCVVLLVGCAYLFSDSYEPYSTEFTLNDEDIQNFKDAAAKFEESIIKEKSEFSISLSSSEFVDAYFKIETQYKIAFLHYCEDTTDKVALENYNYAFKAYNDASNLYNETLKNILVSGSSAVDLIFEGWSEEDKNFILNDKEEAYILSEENEALLLEYRDLSRNDEGWAEAVDEIYIELVKNYNAIAEVYDYTDYYSFASEMGYSRDYTAEQRETLREYVKEYIVPLYIENSARLDTLYAEADDETKAKFDMLMTASFVQNEEIKGYVKSYINSFSGGESGYNAGDYMNYFFMEDRAIFADNENAHDIAYTTFLSYYGEALSYFGPGYQNAFTVVHEMGHFAAFLINGTQNMALDVCEVHSQSNEWLFLAYLDGILEEDVYELYLLARLTDGFKRIILSTAVDECEERIYTSESLASPEDCAAIIDEVMALYGEEIREKLMLDDYFRYVAPDSPVYYLSYAVSEIASIENYTVAAKNLVLAQSNYSDFVYSAFDTEVTNGVLKVAFDKATYEKFVEMFSYGEAVEDAEDTELGGESGTVYVLLPEWYLPAA